MRLSNLIAWAIVILLFFPSTRRIITVPVVGILAVLGIISISSRNASRDNRGL